MTQSEPKYTFASMYWALRYEPGSTHHSMQKPHIHHSPRHLWVQDHRRGRSFGRFSSSSKLTAILEHFARCLLRRLHSTKYVVGCLTSSKPRSLLLIVKYIPSWLPAAGFRRKAKEYAPVIRDLAEIPYTWAKIQLVRNVIHLNVCVSITTQASGVALPSFAMRLLSKPNLTEEYEDSVKWASATLYQGVSLYSYLYNLLKRHRWC